MTTSTGGRRVDALVGLLCCLLFLVGCGAPVEYDDCEIVHVETVTVPTTTYYVLQDDYTVIQLSKSKERWLLSGVRGKVGDRFRISLSDCSELHRWK